MALDFPTSPTISQKYPDPAIAGVPQYVWDGQKWTVTNRNASTTAEYISNSAPTKYLTSGAAWGAADPVVVSDASGTITLNFAAGIDFMVDITGAGRTLANPTNLKSQKGIIILLNYGGTITTWGSIWKFPGGIKPVLQNNAAELISYAYVHSKSAAYCSFAPNLA